MSLRTLFAVSAAAAALAAASAALAQEDRPWSGWYAGVNLGGAWGDSSHHLQGVPGDGPVVMPFADANQIALIGSSRSNPGGFTGGGEAGYNWLFKYTDSMASPDFVLIGVETDFDYMDLTQTRTGSFQSALAVNPLVTPTTPVTATVGLRTKADWIWTVRPRLGYNTGSWLFYGTAGLALADIQLRTSYADDATPPNAASISRTSTQVGWTAGAGIGYAIASNWTVKAEYLYADLGDVSQTAVIPNGYGSIIARTGAKTNIARVGVDYRF